MFDRNYNITNPIDEISSYLRANQSGCPSLRRRAVIYNTDGKWLLQACVVEGIAAALGKVEFEETRSYPNAVLFEDWIFLDELPKFIEQIKQGSISFGEYFLEVSNLTRHWTKEMQPLSNSYMPHAGYVWSSKFHDSYSTLNRELLAPKQPYYPNLQEAVKDWLPFPVFQENNDSRKGEIILLLPETRAYFIDAEPDGNYLNLQIAGDESDNLPLEVKGAWWDDEGIHHFTEKVTNGKAQLTIPEISRRLDYMLIDPKGVVYDYQQEDEYRHTGLGRNSTAAKNHTLTNQVRKARLNGEGPTIEFKPFIYPDNDKLNEIVRTVAAFANTQGGEIFLGINDGCELIGIDEKLQEWAKAEANEESCEKYLGEIRGKIRDQLSAHVQLDFSQTIVDGVRIAVIAVTEAKEKPISSRQEKLALYVRRGASNTKASPEEWAEIINTSRNNSFMPRATRF